MRARLTVLLVGIAAVMAGVAAGLTPAASPPKIPPVPGVPTAPRPIASYAFRAEFGVGYEVKWSSQTGPQSGACTPWSDSRGTNEINAGSVDPIRGNLVIYRTATRVWGWGTFNAIGKAKGTVERTLVETGGYRRWAPECGPKPPPYKAPPNDCGTRTFTTNTALLNATVRGPSALKMSPGGLRAINFTVTPLRSPYRRCESTGLAPEFPIKVGLYLGSAEVTALQKLKRGATYRVSDESGNDCTEVLHEGKTCTFTLDLHVTIRRDR